MLPEVHRRRRQIVARPLSEAGIQRTAADLSQIGGVR